MSRSTLFAKRRDPQDTATDLRQRSEMRDLPLPESKSALPPQVAPGILSSMDAEQIKKALERLKDLPAEVAFWRVEIGEDATGEIAVWVWVELAGEHAGANVRQEIRDLVKRTTRTASSAAPVPWIYVRVLEKAEEPRK